MPDLSNFASLDFYGFLIFIGLGIALMIWGAVWLRRADRPSERLSLKAALKWLGKYGVPIPITRNNAICLPGITDTG